MTENRTRVTEVCAEKCSVRSTRVCAEKLAGTYRSHQIWHPCKMSYSANSVFRKNHAKISGHIFGTIFGHVFGSLTVPRVRFTLWRSAEISGHNLQNRLRAHLSVTLPELVVTLTYRSHCPHQWSQSVMQNHRIHTVAFDLKGFFASTPVTLPAPPALAHHAAEEEAPSRGLQQMQGGETADRQRHAGRRGDTDRFIGFASAGATLEAPSASPPRLRRQGDEGHGDSTA